MRMTVSYFEAVNSNVFALHGTRPDGNKCLIQMLLTEHAPLEDLQKALVDFFAKFEEEVVKPAAPRAEPKPIDPSYETLSYDAMYQAARADGVEPSARLNELRAQGWEHMPDHAGLWRKRNVSE